MKGLAKFITRSKVYQLNQRPWHFVIPLVGNVRPWCTHENINIYWILLKHYIVRRFPCIFKKVSQLHKPYNPSHCIFKTPYVSIPIGRIKKCKTELERSWVSVWNEHIKNISKNTPSQDNETSTVVSHIMCFQYDSETNEMIQYPTFNVINNYRNRLCHIKQFYLFGDFHRNFFCRG